MQPANSIGSMAQVLQPELPPELMSRIAREALAAEGSGVQAWVRLSLVCRPWRDYLRGTHSSSSAAAVSPVLTLDSIISAASTHLLAVAICTCHVCS